MLLLHYSKIERINFRCSFPEHTNIGQNENIQEKMVKMLRKDEICIQWNPELAKLNPRLGKKQ